MEIANGQGNRLKELREATADGLSRAFIADRLGVGEPQVRRWELNEVLIPTRHLAPLAKLLGCTVDHLLGLDRQSPETKAAA